MVSYGKFNLFFVEFGSNFPLHPTEYVTLDGNKIYFAIRKESSICLLRGDGKRSQICLELQNKFL
jgi:hypothetical protein